VRGGRYSYSASVADLLKFVEDVLALNDLTVDDVSLIEPRGLFEVIKN
jgi:hypothetical protein